MARTHRLGCGICGVLDYGGNRQIPKPRSVHIQFRLLLLCATTVAFSSAGGQRTAPPAAPVSAPITNVRYSVTFDKSTAAERALRVSMTFNVAGNEPVLLSVPA